MQDRIDLTYDTSKKKKNKQKQDKTTKIYTKYINEVNDFG